METIRLSGEKAYKHRVHGRSNQSTLTPYSSRYVSLSLPPSKLRVQMGRIHVHSGGFSAYRQLCGSPLATDPRTDENL